MSKEEIAENLEAIKNLLNIEMISETVSDSDNISDDILSHNLWGIHIKEKNDALSEENPHVCIGWSVLGDLTGLETVEEFSEVYEQYFDKNNRAKGQEVCMIKRFVQDIKIGDYIIFAESSEFHIGKITSDYYFDDRKNQNQSPDYVNHRKVEWLKTNISRTILSKAMHNSLGTSMIIFGLNDYRAAVVDLLKGSYQKDDDIIVEKDSISLKYKTNIDIGFERNRIVFGAPGTGKSYILKSDCEKAIKDFDAEFERVTFHPEYTYSQFVGSYKPVMGEDGEKIKYQYVPGPFMRIMAAALYNVVKGENIKPYILIIEEINRAKVAAVFGEVFQLLDRDDDGISEYEIQASEDIRRYLADEIGGEPSDFKKIKMPNNLYIWATMNSADQGVFAMDTAFKRRWNFEYLGIDENEDKIQGIGKVLLPGSSSSLEWNTIRKGINEKMTSEQFRVNEDKLLGPFFLSKKILESDEKGMLKKPELFLNAFKSKVIMYLYEDAIKHGRQRFFECVDSSKYSSVCNEFDKNGLAIFGELFEKFL